MARRILLAFGLALLLASAAQATLFDFENANIYSPLPIDLTVDGITAHFSATGQGFSVQAANTMGFTPAGFSGLCIYPSSVYQADLLVSFSQTLTDFSIMFAPQELACDGTATMRVTAYMDASPVGTNTSQAPTPGTWPTGTLSISVPAGFNNVVVHYDSPPPPCDYGPIFMADNMDVIAAPSASVDAAGQLAAAGLAVWPNPSRGAATVSFSLARPEIVSVEIVDVQGRLVRTLAAGSTLPAGRRSLVWDGLDERGAKVEAGVYFCRARAGSEAASARMILIQGR